MKESEFTALFGGVEKIDKEQLKISRVAYELELERLQDPRAVTGKLGEGGVERQTTASRNIRNALNEKNRTKE